MYFSLENWKFDLLGDLGLRLTETVRSFSLPEWGEKVVRVRVRVQVRERPWWKFWAEARNECRPRMGFLPVCEQRGRHVTRSSCRPCRHPLTLFFGQFKEPPCRFNLPTRHAHFLNPEEISYKLSMTSPAVRGQLARFRWAHPPAASSPPDTQPASSIERRYALPPVFCAVK